MKIIFFGTPEIAVESLKALQTNENIEILAVVSQADKPIGRKQILSPTAVKTAAIELNLKVLQPENPSELYEVLKDYNADFYVVFAYGMIMPKKILDLPKHGAINIHTSLLPKYRGASPIQQAILNEDEYSGVSIMRMDEKMDHGDIYLLKKVAISDNDDSESLSQKLSELSSAILGQALKDIEEKFLTPIPQNHSLATYCKKISKEDGEISFNKTAKDIKNMIRAYTPWPGCHFKIQDKKIKILEANTTPENTLSPGEFKTEENKLQIGTTNGTLEPTKLQLEGKNPSDIKSFLNGYGKLFT